MNPSQPSSAARITRWRGRSLDMTARQRWLPCRLARILLVLGLVSGISATDSVAQMWPRLIVGVVMGTAGAEDAGALVRVRARLADGTVLDGIRQGCPAISEVVCSFSFFTTPRDQTVTLIVESVDSRRWPGDQGRCAGSVQLSGTRHHLCGRLAVTGATAADRLAPNDLARPDLTVKARSLLPAAGERAAPVSA